MTIIKVTVELVSDIVESVEYHVATDDSQKAIDYVIDRLKEGGWEYKSIRTIPVWVHKIT